ncbi:hypothetical protein WJM97_22350 [Okeanomitos corallinicola TIOX110]|uniref:Uncharacterized protein n=1 Tax=Okeanomitos corallinicola TIOX110 TaxID=3133117 RepID=A0ABZ2USW7_9CYAN
MFRLEFQPEAEEKLVYLQLKNPKKYKKILKILGLMQTNLRHPSLKTHEYQSLSGPDGEKVFEAYVENNTPGAWRVFWYYGPGQGVITIFTIEPHP